MTTETKVGTFVLASFVILTATVGYLANAQFRSGGVPYRTYLHYAGGLESGAPVLFGGIKAGTVTSVRPGNTTPGNYYRNHACHFAGITSLNRIGIANCAPYFFVRHFYGRHIGLWILHTILLIIFWSSMPELLVGRNSLRVSVR